MPAPVQANQAALQPNALPQQTEGFLEKHKVAIWTGIGCVATIAIVAALIFSGGGVGALASLSATNSALNLLGGGVVGAAIGFTAVKLSEKHKAEPEVQPLPPIDLDTIEDVPDTQSQTPQKSWFARHPYITGVATVALAAAAAYCGYTYYYGAAPATPVIKTETPIFPDVIQKPNTLASTAPAPAPSPPVCPLTQTQCFPFEQTANATLSATLPGQTPNGPFQPSLWQRVRSYVPFLEAPHIREQGTKILQEYSSPQTKCDPAEDPFYAAIWHAERQCPSMSHAIRYQQERGYDQGLSLGALRNLYGRQPLLSDADARSMYLEIDHTIPDVVHHLPPGDCMKGALTASQIRSDARIFTRERMSSGISKLWVNFRDYLKYGTIPDAAYMAGKYDQPLNRAATCEALLGGAQRTSTFYNRYAAGRV